MMLFKKDIDLILKLTNLALILWFIGALIAVYVNFINIMMPSRIMTYTEYTETNCTTNNSETDCTKLYNQYKSSNKMNTYEQQKTLYISLSMVIIVGGAVYLVNKKGLKGDK